MDNSLRDERYPGGGVRTRVRTEMGARKQLVQRPSSQRSQHCFRNCGFSNKRRLWVAGAHLVVGGEADGGSKRKKGGLLTCRHGAAG